MWQARQALQKLCDVQLQDVHKWSFGRPEPKGNKANDEAGSEDIPLEGLDNGLAIQGSNGSHDRWVSASMSSLACWSWVNRLPLQSAN